jgi:hypothetical protein
MREPANMGSRMLQVKWKDSKQTASSDAEQFVVAIFEILGKFISEEKIEVSITSVIIKMQD